MKQQASTQLSLNVKAAIYCRLSRDDENGGESVSIANQKAMLQHHVKQEGWDLIGVYADDGYSGTNFDRPDFNRMLDDIEKGFVNLVITKDLSRLGRDYLKTGYYTEVYFPEKKVRYIALNDGFDSQNKENDIAPFRNILNEMYAKDQSRKMKSAWRSLAQNGGVLGRYAPFGYRWSDTEKHRIVIDEETSPIIHRIFDMALQGMGIQAIRSALYKDKVLTPSAWQNKRNTKLFARYFTGDREGKYYDWEMTSIKKMLGSVTYLGHTAHYECEKASYKDRRRVRNPKDKHLIIENTHEPIIDPDTFNLVQKRINSRKRRTKIDGPTFFTGLVECADCGWKMTVRWMHHWDTNYHHQALTCSQYRTKGVSHCTTHFITYNNLSQIVLEDIQKCARAVLKDESRVVHLLTQEADQRTNTQQATLKTELKRITDRLEELDKLVANLYEEYTLGRLQKRNYTKLSEQYQSEQTKLLTKVEEMKREAQLKKEVNENAGKWLELIKKYTDIQELNAPLLNELIEKIIVHERTKSTYALSQKIEIHYRFVGSIDLFF